MNERCPWPERVGCEGVIVERPTGPEGQLYPWHGRGRDEVIVLLDDDPLLPLRTGSSVRRWTCAVDRQCVEVI